MAMAKKLQKIIRNFQAVVRNDKMEGRDYLVVPMIMLVEGVHSGSMGPLYYPAEELAKVPEVWNQKPVVVYHPGGVTACSPEEATNRKIGVIMNTVFEDGKLKAEAWLEEERIEAVDNRVLVAIENEEMLELSTGLFVEEEDSPGNWNGEPYDTIVRNIRPDHLAILPDVEGACSIEDGAGFLRLNSKNNSFVFNMPKTKMNTKQKKYFTKNKKEITKHISVTIKNELSFDDIRMTLSSLIRASIGEDYIWVEDVFEDYFVYERDGKLYKQSYEEKEGSVNIIGLPEQVVKDVNYVIANRKEVKMDKEKLVVELIANESTQFTEDDKEMLLALNEDVLGKMVPVENEEGYEEGNDADAGAEEATSEEGEGVENTDKPKTVDEYIKEAPADIQDVLRNGVESHKAEKDRLVAGIVANEQCDFTKNELEAKGIQELRKLAKITKTVQNGGPRYDGQVDGFDAPTENQEEAMPMPVMNFGEKEEEDKE